MPLLELMSPDSIKDYISGLLLGTEIKEAVQSGFGNNVNPVICGTADLVARYKKALEICGIQTELGKDHLAAFGLYRIAAAAQLL
jgi:2-keto-3-deoxy-galactonokinase